MPPLTFATATVQSRSHRFNLDAIYTHLEEDRGLFMLLDGSGQDDEAGQQVLHKVVEAMSEAFKPLLSAQITTGQIVSTMRMVYQMAHVAVQQSQVNVGISVTAVLIKSVVTIAHIGSTRAYALSPEGIDQLTTDHTVDEQVVEFGDPLPGIQADPVLVQVIGQHVDAPDTLTHHFEPGTALLLVSDGLYRAGAQVIDYGGGPVVTLPLADEEMLKIIVESTDPQDACDRLIADAARRSQRDNASVVLISNGFPFRQE